MLLVALDHNCTRASLVKVMLRSFTVMLASLPGAVPVVNAVANCGELWSSGRSLLAALGRVLMTFAARNAGAMRSREARRNVRCFMTAAGFNMDVSSRAGP